MNRKRISRSFGLLFLAILVAFMVSCQAGTQNEEFDISMLSTDDGTADFLGKDFLIRNYERYALNDNTLLSFSEESVFYDLALQRINDIGKKYNCTISTNNEPGQDPDSTFTPSVMAGLYFCDMMMTMSYDIRGQVEGMLFEPLISVSDILDYTDSGKWGSPYLLEWMVWDGSPYGVLPVQWPEYYITCFSNVFVFNESFAKRLGQTDPREYLEKGSWSRETLGNMMPEYTFMDGEIEVKGMAYYAQHFIDQALRSNNAQVYKEEGDGIVSGYHTEAGRNALEWANDFLHVTYKDYIHPTGGDDENYNRFINGESALLLTYANYAFGSRSRIAFSIDDYCILPFPNGPERKGQEYTAQLESVKSTVIFPLGGHDINASAFICNELFEQLGEYDGDSLKDFYLRSFFFDSRDLDIVMEMVRNSRYTFYADGIRGLIVDKIASGPQSVTQLLESAQDQFDDLLQRRIAPTVNTMNELFGKGWDR